MPVFEIETPEGVFEVEAPDMDTAVRVLSGQKGAPAPEPVTTPKQDRVAPDGWSPQAEADAYEKVRGNGTFADMTDSAMRGIPFSDEITSGIGAPFRAAGSWLQGEGFDIGREYDRKMQVEAELQRRRDERSPIASTAGQIAGGLGVGGVAAKGGLSLLQGAKPTLGSLAGRGAAEGVIWGGLYGAGEGRGLEERASNALFGAGTGTAVGAAGGAVARIGAKNVPKAPSIDDLRAAGQAAYQRADQAGVVFTPNALAKVRSNIVADFTDFGFLPANQPGAAAVLKQIEAMQGQNVTLKGLDTLRKMASNAYQPGNKPNNALVAKMIDRIDELVAKPARADILMGNAREGMKALQEARGIWSRMSKAEQVATAIERAELRAASTGSGGNVDNATRQNLRRLLEKGRGFTAEERKALEKVVRGTKGQNALRLAGKLSPQGNGLMAALGIGGTMVNPAVGIASLTGLGAKAVADGMTQKNAALLQALIRNGGALAPTLSGTRKALVDATARTGGMLSGR